MHREEKGKETSPEPFLLLTPRVLTFQTLSTLCVSLTSQAWMLRHQNPLFTGDDDAVQWRSALEAPESLENLFRKVKRSLGARAAPEGGRHLSSLSK